MSEYIDEFGGIAPCKNCKSYATLWNCPFCDDYDCYEEIDLEGAKNTEQPLQPENGKKLCAVEYCKYWERGACASENKCIGVSVSG